MRGLQYFINHDHLRDLQGLDNANIIFPELSLRYIVMMLFLLIEYLLALFKCSMNIASCESIQGTFDSLKSLNDILFLYILYFPDKSLQSVEQFMSPFARKIWKAPE